MESGGLQRPIQGVHLPLELRPFKKAVDVYVTAKLKQFAEVFTRRFDVGLDPQQVDVVVAETLGILAQEEHMMNNNRALRLVLRHDCQSSGCGEIGCLLCQYNPSRLCKQNLKSKYLIDDSLKAKCGANLRVELVDETGACHTQGLPLGTRLEVHVLNGEKYKELCPENTLLTQAQLQACAISHHTKALLKREGGSDDQLRCFLELEHGQESLSDLHVTTSSEALLAGKAPTFRLLIWAVDASGEPVSNITYVVSESFVVATKRVKHAIKSDIPSVTDSISKLVHIGRATCDKLLDLRGTGREEGYEFFLPDDLNCIDNVGQFQRLLEQCDMNSDLKAKIRHLLKLSPEKWEEVSQHAMAAVAPDFRHRIWCNTKLRTGLLFACKNGSVIMDRPIALVKMAAGPGEEDEVIPMEQLEPELYNSIPRLQEQAVQSWYAAHHPDWAIFWKQDLQYPGTPQPSPAPAMYPLGNHQQSAFSLQPVDIAKDFPQFPMTNPTLEALQQNGDNSMGSGALINTRPDNGHLPLGIPSIEMLRSDLLPTMEQGQSVLWGQGISSLGSFPFKSGSSFLGASMDPGGGAQQQQPLPAQGMPSPPDADPSKLGTEPAKATADRAMSLKMSMSLDLEKALAEGFSYDPANPP